MRLFRGRLINSNFTTLTICSGFVNIEFKKIKLISFKFVLRK